MDKQAKTSVPLHTLIQDRWSPRSLTGARIKTEILTKLFEAARWAPSSRNQQPWGFVLVTKDDGDVYERDKVREVCRFPDDFAPICALAIGGLGRTEDLPNSAREKDEKPRERLPLQETVFAGTWETSANLGAD